MRIPALALWLLATIPNPAATQIVVAVPANEFWGDVPVTPAPPGYGHYCSISYASGGWAFAWNPDIASDPCGDLLKSSPGGTEERAGLWSVNGQNNVLVRCGTEINVSRGAGQEAIAALFNASQGKSNCVFTVSPTELPVFVRPYGTDALAPGLPNAGVSLGRGFDYNVYRIPMDVSMFGQTQNPSLPARSVDRLGRQRNFIGTDEQCAARELPSGCHIIPGEAAYDWPMPAGKPIHAVAAGIVRGARIRDVSAFDCASDFQVEVYIEHQVGSGKYGERFITYYAHMDSENVEVGQIVGAGQAIGPNGSTGCSSTPHLHMSVWRLTNLSGARSYAFRVTPDGHGVNGIHGSIDPFGWAGKQHIDPFSWMFLNQTFNDPNVGVVRDPGAFSINLWQPGHAPPSDWEI